MKKQNFEENLNQLEEIVQKLESGDLNLEDSIKCFEQGVKLSKVCEEMLDNTHKKISLLIEKDDKIIEKNFEEENELL